MESVPQHVSDMMKSISTPKELKVLVKRVRTSDIDGIEIECEGYEMDFVVRRYPGRGWVFLGERMDRLTRSGKGVDWTETQPEAVLAAMTYMGIPLTHTPKLVLQGLEKTLEKRMKKSTKYSKNPRVHEAISSLIEQSLITL
jgi:hypothetical protein